MPLGRCRVCSCCVVGLLAGLLGYAGWVARGHGSFYACTTRPCVLRAVFLGSWVSGVLGCLRAGLFVMHGHTLMYSLNG